MHMRHMFIKVWNRRKSLFCIFAILSCMMVGMPTQGARRIKAKAEAVAQEPVSDNTKGFYKDLFVDGGINVSSRDYLPSARFMQLQWESFLCTAQKGRDTTTYSAIDTLMQRQFIVGNPLDENGALLFPDGQPRFRMVFMNGGAAARHGRSLGEDGRNRYREYVRNGGSYVGDCAGMFLGSRAVKGDSALKYLDAYLGIWPGLTISTGLETSQTNLTIEENAPLLRFYDFGGDHQVDSVYHNGGGFAVTDTLWPEGTEILARYEVTGRDLKLKRDIQGLPAIWAYKADDHTGRVLLCGSHPEFVGSGEKLDLMLSMVKYAMEGTVAPRLKGVLLNGQKREMYRKTRDNDPDFTAVGDRQYHHFTVDVPHDADTLRIILKPKPGTVNFDLFLLAQPNEYAYLETATYKHAGAGCDKTLIIPNPPAGRLFVSVFCNTTVESTQTPYGTQYSGRLDVLNGVPYSIQAEWNLKGK